MANKKVFTNLTFEGNSELINPKLHPTAGSSAPASTGVGQVYFDTGSGGVLNVQYSAAGQGPTWRGLHTADIAFSTSALFTSTLADGNPPFAITSTTKVANLNADLLDGATTSNTNVGDTIPVRDSDKLFHVGTATAGTHVVNKSYVDNAIQGLDHKGSAKVTTTGSINLTALTAQSNLDQSGALTAGDRVLVKDQSTASQNGIYVAATSGWTRATDADGSDLTEGSYVFVETGDTLANSSWVLSDTSAHTWTQFSGAGQISVESNGATAAPLTKSGDTINFQFDTAKFGVSGGAFTIQGNAINAGDIAENAITPSELQDTGAFTVGQVQATSASSSSDWARLHPFEVSLNRPSGYNYINFPASSSSLLFRRTGYETVLRMKPDGKSVFFNNLMVHGGETLSNDFAGLGTLHVSTARYGSELVTNGDFSNTTSTDTTVAALNGWSNGGTHNSTNKFTIDGSNQCRLICDSTSGVVAISQGIFTSGKTYKVSVDIKSITGTIQFRIGTGTQNYTTTGVKTFYGVADTATLEIKRASACDVTFDDVSVKEDTLSTNGTISVNGAADDLVVANSGNAGITVLSKDDEEGSLFFADKGATHAGGIYFNHVDDSLNLTSGGGTLGLTVDSSQNVKIPNGGLGVGGVTGPTGGGLFVAGNYTGLERASTTTTNAVLYLTKTGSSGNQVLANFNYGATAGTVGSGTIAVQLAKDTSYFNSNVAIGGTTAEHSLQIVTSSDTDGIQIRRHSASEGSTATLGFRTSSGAHAFNTSEVRAVRTNLPNAGDNKLSFLTQSTGALTEHLSVDGYGTHDHHGNPIVNSASIQGLQDGAAYDFDGSNTTDHITLGDCGNPENFSVSVWFKSETLSNYQGILHTAFTGSATNSGLRLEVNASGSFGAYFGRSNAVYTSSGLGTIVAGQWYHALIVVDKTNLKFTSYLDGVEVDSDTVASTLWPSTNTLANVTLGRGFQDIASRSFNGQIRDVKIFPSALAAADVRKLYSGENPKKNLNVELVKGGKFNSASDITDNDPDNWRGQTDGGSNTVTMSVVSGEMKVTSAPSAETLAYTTVTTVAGKAYSFSVDARTGTSSSALIRVGTGVASSTFLNTTATTQETINTTFVATSTTTYISIGTNQAGGKTAYFDNVSVTEVSTLVDFNSRSASSETWYNAAIPSLYNGSLEGGVTLSAGSTDHRVDGELAVSDRITVNNTGHNCELRLTDSGDGSYARVRYNSPNLSFEVDDAGGASNSKIVFEKDDAQIAEFDLNGNLFLASGKKLGVGTSPSNALHAKIDTDSTLTALLENTGTSTTARHVLELNSSGSGTGSRVFNIKTGANDPIFRVTGTEVRTYGSSFSCEGDNVVATFKNTGTSSQDTGIRIVGARNGLTNSVTSYLLFDDYDNNAGTGLENINLGRVYGSMATANGRDGHVTIEGYDGSSYQRGLTVYSDGKVGISNAALTAAPLPQGLLDVKGSIRGEADDYTKLLIHSGKVSGATDFSDSSPNGATLTVGDDLKHFTMPSNHWGASLYNPTGIYFDGTTDDHLSVADDADFDFGTGDLTIDFWLYHDDAMQTWSAFFEVGEFNVTADGHRGFGLWTNSSGMLRLHSTNTYDTTNGAIAPDTWYHLAIVRASGVVKIYINGVSQTLTSNHGDTSSTAWAEAVGMGDNAFLIGRATHTSNYSWAGWLNEFRVSKGIARWTSDFTPPARPYSTVNDEFFNDYDKIAATGIGTGVMRIDSSGDTTLTGDATVNGALSVTGDTTLTGSLAAVSTQVAQTTALISARANGNSFEFGHGNNNGYASTIGCSSNNGYPFLAFSAEAGTNSNTFKTRGLKGNVISADTSGNLTFNQVTTANADNQALVERMRLDSLGNFGVGCDASRELEVSGDGNVYVRVSAKTSSDSTALELKNTGGTWTIKNDDTATETLKFGNSGGTHLSIDSSGDTKVHGKLGVGGVASSYQLEVHGTSATSTAFIKGTSSGASARLRVDGYNDSLIDFGRNGQGRWRFNRKSGTDDLSLMTMTNADWSSTAEDSTLMFFDYSDQRVAIGATSANGTLSIGQGSNSVGVQDTPALQIGASATNNYRFGIYTTSEQAVIENRNGEDGFLFRTRPYDGSTYGGVEDALTVGGSVVNQHGNSIVNSATVQGLQDGACYDFDGSSGYVDCGTGILDGATAFSASIWFKSTNDASASSVPGLIAIDDGTERVFYVGTQQVNGVNGIRTWIASDGTNQQYQNFPTGSGTTPVFTTGVWCHLVFTWDSSGSLVLYSDGVLVDSVASNSNADSALPTSISESLKIGTRITVEFEGQIRDAKIFPSALTAPDVRKLYSGENPKKNLNVNLVSNGTFDDFTGWTDESTGSTASASVVSGRLKLDGTSESDRAKARIGSAITIVDGAYYKVSFSFQEGGSSNHAVRIGPSSASSAYHNVNNALSSGEYSAVFKADQSSTNLWIEFEEAANTVSYVDNVSIVRVETLVDFNPQSASRSTWGNQAIPSLYNGTLQGGVSLSQGNAYWGNIKQHVGITGNRAVDVAAAMKVSGWRRFTDPAGVGHSHSTILIDDTTGQGGLGGTPAGYPRNLIRYNSGQSVELGQVSSLVKGMKFYAGSTTTTDIRFYTAGANERLTIQHDGDTKIHERLGIGANPTSSYQQYTSTTLDGIGLFKSYHSSYGRLVISTTVADADAQLAFMSEGSTKWSIGNNAGDTDKFQISPTSGNFGASVKFTLDASGNCGIGEPSPSAPLHIRRNMSSGGSGANTILRLGAIDLPAGLDLQAGDGTRLLFEIPDLDGSQIGASIDAVKEQANDSYGQTALVFNVTQDDETLDEAFRISSDGTQNHSANRIVNSQTVNDLHRTAEPSLRFDGDGDAVAMSTPSSIGTEYTLSAWVKLESTSEGTIITHCAIGAERRALQVFSGVIRLSYYEGSSWVGVSGGSLTAGRWYHVAGVRDSSGQKIYVDGVDVTTGTSAGYVSNGFRVGWSGSNTSGSEYYLKGEIRDVRIHNRALEDTEVAAAYNGESTPWKYADAGAERITLGDFTGSTGQPWSWNSGWSHSSTNENMAFDGTTGTGRVYQTPFTAADAGKVFRVTFTVGGGTGLIWIGNSAGSDPFGNGDYTNYTVGTHSEVFTLPSGQTTLAFYSQTASGAFTLDDVSVVQTGEIAAYTPRSINDDDGEFTDSKKRWYDTTSNANHGDINGATVVGYSDLLGTQRIKGRSGTRDHDDDGRLVLGDHANHGFLDYCEGTGQGVLSVGNSRNADGAKVQLTVNDSPKFTVVGSGEVKATSGDSTNLIQVARVTSGVLTFDGTTANIAFRITHNLGTAKPIVQVWETSGNRGMVETEVRIGDWTNSADAAPLTTLQGSTLTNYVTVVFSSHQGDLTTFDYCVTG